MIPKLCHHCIRQWYTCIIFPRFSRSSGFHGADVKIRILSYARCNKHKCTILTKYYHTVKWMEMKKKIIKIIADRIEESGRWKGIYLKNFLQTKKLYPNLINWLKCIARPQGDFLHNLKTPFYLSVNADKPWCCKKWMKKLSFRFLLCAIVYRAIASSALSYKLII